MKLMLPAVLLLAAGIVSAAEPDLSETTARLNYSLGHQLGADLKRQGIELRHDAILQGIADAAAGAQPKLTQEEMRAVLTEQKRKVVAEMREKATQRDRALRADGARYMEENAEKEGVVTTASGLQYRSIQEGTGKAPGPEDQVTVHYRGTRVDGAEFDSSIKRGKPATFKLAAVIKGWAEGLQMMKEGGKAELVIPPELAYGERGRLAHQTLIFEVELIAVGAPEPASEGAHPPAD